MSYLMPDFLIDDRELRDVVAQYAAMSRDVTEAAKSMIHLRWMLKICGSTSLRRDQWLVHILYGSRRNLIMAAWRHACSNSEHRRAVLFQYFRGWWTMAEIERNYECGTNRAASMLSPLHEFIPNRKRITFRLSDDPECIEDYFGCGKQNGWDWHWEMRRLDRRTLRSIHGSSFSFRCCQEHARLYLSGIQGWRTIW